VISATANDAAAADAPADDDAVSAAQASAALDALHLICRIGDVDYALPARRVVEMETYPGATPVPGAPPWVAGLVQVRGRVVPAIDVRARLGLAPAPVTLDTRVVLVERGARVVGLVVDRAREVLPLPGEPQAVPAELADRAAGGFVSGVAHGQDRSFLLIDVDSLLAQELRHGDRDPGH
jgi:purine-binding chemotaxis protein CheW